MIEQTYKELNEHLPDPPQGQPDPPELAEKRARLKVRLARIEELFPKEKSKPAQATSH